MLLTEAEGKALLRQAGVQTPPGQLVETVDQLETVDIKFPVYVKAQVLHGNRGQQGLVKKVTDQPALTAAVKALLGRADQHDQPIQQVLVEPVVIAIQLHYLSLGYDTRSRRLVARYSPQGGGGMDDRGESVTTVPLSLSAPPSQFPPHPALLPMVTKLHQAVIDHDATLLEINPLAETQHGWISLDAKVELEEAARFRHPEWEQYGQRSSLGRAETELERQAHQVSRQDHRGVAGESFVEFDDGDVGVMASGGGASILAMDALMAASLKPANYTEYSGNPPREKVKALTRVVLSIPRLRGLFVVGSNANFTDIYETLAGVVDGLLESPYARQPDFAVLIRRGGPRWQEAFAMVNERLAGTSLKFKLFGPEFPILETAAEFERMLATPSAENNGHQK